MIRIMQSLCTQN